MLNFDFSSWVEKSIIFVFGTNCSSDSQCARKVVSNQSILPTLEPGPVEVPAVPAYFLTLF